MSFHLLVNIREPSDLSAERRNTEKGPWTALTTHVCRIGRGIAYVPAENEDRRVRGKICAELVKGLHEPIWWQRQMREIVRSK